MAISLLGNSPIFPIPGVPSQSISRYFDTVPNYNYGNISIDPNADYSVWGSGTRPGTPYVPPVGIPPWTPGTVTPQLSTGIETPVAPVMGGGDSDYTPLGSSDTDWTDPDSWITDNITYGDKLLLNMLVPGMGTVGEMLTGLVTTYNPITDVDDYYRLPWYDGSAGGGYGYTEDDTFGGKWDADSPFDDYNTGDLWAKDSRLEQIAADILGWGTAIESSDLTDAEWKALMTNSDGTPGEIKGPWEGTDVYNTSLEAYREAERINAEAAELEAELAAEEAAEAGAQAAHDALVSDIMGTSAVYDDEGNLVTAATGVTGLIESEADASEETLTDLINAVSDSVTTNQTLTDDQFSDINTAIDEISLAIGDNEELTIQQQSDLLAELEGLYTDLLGTDAVYDDEGNLVNDATAGVLNDMQEAITSGQLTTKDLDELGISVTDELLTADDIAALQLNILDGMVTVEDLATVGLDIQDFLVGTDDVYDEEGNLVSAATTGALENLEENITSGQLNTDDLDALNTSITEGMIDADDLEALGLTITDELLTEADLTALNLNIQDGMIDAADLNNLQEALTEALTPTKTEEFVVEDTKAGTIEEIIEPISETEEFVVEDRRGTITPIPRAEGYDAEGYDAEGYDRDGYDREGFDAFGYDISGYDAEGYDISGYDAEGYDSTGFNVDNRNAKGLINDEYNIDGNTSSKGPLDISDLISLSRHVAMIEPLTGDSLKAADINMDGKVDRLDVDLLANHNVGKMSLSDPNNKWVDVNNTKILVGPDGLDVSGYGVDDYNTYGMDLQGYDADGYDIEGFDEYGYDISGYDAFGYNNLGYDTEGYDADGYNRAGFDAEGYNTEGYREETWNYNNALGRHIVMEVDREGYNKAGYKYDADSGKAYDRDGWTYDSYNRPSHMYNKEGANQLGNTVTEQAEAEQVADGTASLEGSSFGSRGEAEAVSEYGFGSDEHFAAIEETQNNITDNTGSGSDDTSWEDSDAATDMDPASGWSGLDSDFDSVNSTNSLTNNNNTSSGSSSSSSSKVICTAMNEDYGFGKYRNAIWLKYAAINYKDKPEMEAGYHALCLPMLRIRKKWYGKPIYAWLKHVARHRTADLRAEMYGKKRDRIGQAWRFILEPLCYFVGKRLNKGDK